MQIGRNGSLCYLVKYLPKTKKNEEEFEIKKSFSDFARENIPLNSFTNKILAVQRNNSQIINQWCEWVRDEFNNFNLPIDYIVRALNNKEIVWTETGFDKIGRTIALTLKAEYIPSLLIKKRENSSLYHLNRDERIKEMSDIYEINTECCINLENKRILIIDVIYATGVTSNEIFKTINRNFPNSKCFIFTLGLSTKRERLDANKDVTRKYFPDVVQ